MFIYYNQATFWLLIFFIQADEVAYVITHQRAFILRLDDIQHFVFITYRNKLRITFKASP